MLSTSGDNEALLHGVHPWKVPGAPEKVKSRQWAGDTVSVNTIVGSVIFSIGSASHEPSGSTPSVTHHCKFYIVSHWNKTSFSKVVGHISIKLSLITYKITFFILHDALRTWNNQNWFLGFSQGQPNVLEILFSYKTTLSCLEIGRINTAPGNWNVWRSMLFSLCSEKKYVLII